MKNINVTDNAVSCIESEHSIIQNQISSKWLTTAEAAAYLGMTVNALNICVHRNQVTVYKNGRKSRFAVDELAVFFSKKKGTRNGN